MDIIGDLSSPHWQWRGITAEKKPNSTFRLYLLKLYAR